MRRRVRVEEESEINITPLLDIVFIMLIFFIKLHILHKSNLHMKNAK